MKYAIGIDPGQKTGVAIWNLETMKWETIITTTPIEAQEIVKLYHENGGCMVLCEDARLRKWFGNSGSEKWQGAGWAKSASKGWEDFLKYHKIPYRMQKPGATWKGPAAAKTWARITGWNKKTQDHARDAAWMVFEISRTKIETLCGLTS